MQKKYNTFKKLKIKVIREKIRRKRKMKKKEKNNIPKFMEYSKGWAPRVIYSYKSIH